MLRSWALDSLAAASLMYVCIAARCTTLFLLKYSM